MNLRMVLGVALVLAWPAAVAAAPPTTDSGLELPPPPDADTDGGDTEGEDTDGLSEEERERLKDEAIADHIERGNAALKMARFREARAEFDSALELRDGDAAAYRGRAYAHEGLTREGACPREAIEDLLLLEVYDPKGLWPAERGVVVDWMGRCADAFDAERLALAEQLSDLPIEALGRDRDVRVVAAQLRAKLGRAAKREKPQKAERQKAVAHLLAYREECAMQDRKPAVEALALQGDLHRELDEIELARDAYKLLLETYPDAGKIGEDAARWKQELDLQIKVRDLQKNQGGRPTEEARAAYDRGRTALRAGQIDVARRELEAAIASSPWWAPAYYLLGDVHARDERLADAVEALEMAAQLEPYDYAAHMALGMLYKAEFRGAEDAKALDHLDRALSLRPDLYVLHFHLGELYARSDKAQAREHFRRFIEVAHPDDPLLASARDAVRDLERDVVEEPNFVIPRVDPSLKEVDPELYRLISEARVLGAEQGDWERAEKTLLQARESFPNSPPLLNMLAQVAQAQGRPGHARMYWEESLEVDSEQADVHERLGLMLRDQPSGVAHLRKAAELGSVNARFELARRLWDSFDWWTASRELDLYLLESGPYDLQRKSGEALRERWDSYFRRIYFAAALFFCVLIAVPAGWLFRRLRGSSLTRLLHKAPKSYPEIARILSLIRHEILKHNTSFLVDVGRALELDQADAPQRAAVLSRRLFGDPSDREQGGERRGIYGRFLGYVSELEKVGRAHGVTLNLRRKDPIFSAMLSAFEDVAEHADTLSRVGEVRSGRRVELGKVLQRSGDVLGRRAFERLSGLIQELCIADVTPDLLTDVYERVRTEDAFSAVPVAPLEVQGDAARIRVFRTDLEDILANVFRNSLSSSARYAAPPVGVGVDLETETDEITGLSSLAIRIKDRSPERLTNEMLRGRYVERGMGITADLLSRYDGSIGVESEPGWEKAVVLRFFALEGSSA